MTAIIARALKPSEWQAFKAFRLGALKAAPGVFFTSYDEAAARSDQEWQEIIGGIDHQTFGLFDGKSLVGIAGVFTSRDDPSGATAMFGMAFIDPDYRGRSLSHMLYDARLGWLRARKQFKRVTICHRASNKAVARILHHYGFTAVDRQLQCWPDGAEEEEIIYELKL